MDDDKVEYAEIENGHPIIARATAAKNRERQTTKGIVVMSNFL